VSRSRIKVRVLNRQLATAQRPSSANPALEVARRVRWLLAFGIDRRKVADAHPSHGEAVVISTSSDTMQSAFRIRLEPKQNVAYRRDLRHGIGNALESGSRRVIVDCSAWSELDLIFLSALVDCAKLCDEQGAEFEVENLHADLRSRIGALRMDGHLRLK
jgi:anti-anti-sigma regulatory factor